MESRCTRLMPAFARNPLNEQGFLKACLGVVCGVPCVVLLGIMYLLQKDSEARVLLLSSLAWGPKLQDADYACPLH